MDSQSKINIELIRTLFQSFDAGQFEVVRGLLAADLYFQFGSFEPATGIDAPGEVTRPILSRIQRIQHELIAVWAPEPDVVVTEMSVTYHRDDGQQFCLPCANTFRIRDGKIFDYRVYMDVTPILA